MYQFILETDIAFDMLIKFEQPVVSSSDIISLLVNEELPEEPEYVVTFRENIKYKKGETSYSIYKRPYQFGAAQIFISSGG